MKVVFVLVKMNYEAERAMNQKRLRMEGEPGHGVVQGNGLPLNYIGKYFKRKMLAENAGNTLKLRHEIGLFYLFFIVQQSKQTQSYQTTDKD